jgi:hypothetical protein
MAQAISGYRSLTDEEIGAINRIKNEANKLSAFIDNEVLLLAAGDSRSCDPRWVSIGKTHLQQGFMAIIRAIAQPSGF